MSAIRDEYDHADSYHLTDPDAWQDARDAMRDELPVHEPTLQVAPGFPSYISRLDGRLWCDVTDAALLDGVRSVDCDGWGRCRVTFDDGTVRDLYSSEHLEAAL